MLNNKRIKEKELQMMRLNNMCRQETNVEKIRKQIDARFIPIVRGSKVYIIDLDKSDTLTNRFKK